MRDESMNSRPTNPRRRRWLQGVTAGVLGCGLPRLLSLEALARTGRSAARNVLVIYEEGGISQMDTWDPKPSAPVDHRSPYEPIATNVPGIITEMGRTPRLNKWQGRDHWARAMSVAFAGAGVRGGQVVGETDSEAADVITRPYSPYDFAETVYRKLGITTERRVRMPDGRQVEFSDGGRPIHELF